MTTLRKSANRSPYQIKLDTFQRMLMWYLASRPLGLVHVTEFPKSGGSWVSQMLADYLELPFPRNQRPRWERCIMHGHYLYSKGFGNVVCVFRDGRDAMVSAYYHKLFYTDRNEPWIVDRYRRQMPFSNYDDVKENMADFIEFMFTEEARGFKHFTWSEFVRSWHDKPAPKLRYEDLLNDTRGTLRDALEILCNESVDVSRLHAAVNKYDFEKQTGRRRGQQDQSSFLRKGISGDWRNMFDLRARRVFRHFGGDELKLLGYEASLDYRHW